jgi:hypothetical protein
MPVASVVVMSAVAACLCPAPDISRCGVVYGDHSSGLHPYNAHHVIIMQTTMQASNVCAVLWVVLYCQLTRNSS